MIAEDVTPPSHGDDGHLGTAGAAGLPVAPATTRTTLDALEQALTHLTELVLRTVTQSEGHAAAQLVHDNIGVIVDGIWAATNYRRLGHRVIDGDVNYLQITSWVPADVVAVADHIMNRVRL